MKTHVQTGLVIAALLFLFWGVVLMFGQDSKFAMFSTGAYDSVSVSMLGAAFFGYVLILVIVASNPAPDTVGSIAAALIVLAIVAGYQVLVSHAMPMGTSNVISLVVTAGLGIFLMIGRTQMGDAEGTKASPARTAAKTSAPAPRASSRPASKKKAAAKKTTTKKKAARK